MWKRDPDGDVVVNDERDAVDKDGVLIAVRWWIGASQSADLFNGQALG